MPNSTHFFFMCPPIEIEAKKGATVVAKVGHFEFQHNKIIYRLANSTINFIVLYPEESLGQIAELPSTLDYNSTQLLGHLFRGLTEVCFLPKDTKSKSFLQDFIYGNWLPFSQRQYGAGIYRLYSLHPNVFEEFYRLTEALEESITTTIATFDENVFVPFKQRVIGTLHTDGEDRDEKAKTALMILTREFPQFINLHQDLHTILNDQAKKISEYQQLSFSIISPLLRKIRMMSTLRNYFEIDKRKKGIEIRMTPQKVDPYFLAEKLTPIVKPR